MVFFGNDVINVDRSSVSINNVLEPDEKIGCLTNFEARIKLLEGSRPSFFESRPLPIHIKPLVVDENKRMTKEYIIEAAPPGGSEWASPIVVVTKPNGKILIVEISKWVLITKSVMITFLCQKLKRRSRRLLVALYLQNLTYQMPIFKLCWTKRAETLRLSLLRSACTDSRDWCPGSSLVLLYFQKAMEDVLGDLDKHIIYQDDVLIGASNDEELRTKVKTVIDRLTGGMSLNLSKSIMKAKSLIFLGYKVSGCGISLDPTLVSKILQTETPQSRKELETFLGLANFFGRFVDGYADLVYPLNELRKRNTSFDWISAHDSAFKSLKHALSSEPVVKPFDKNK